MKKRKTKNANIIRPFFEQVSPEEIPDFLEGTAKGEWLVFAPIIAECGLLNTQTKNILAVFCQELDLYKDCLVRLADMEFVNMAEGDIAAMRKMRDQCCDSAAEFLQRMNLSPCDIQELELPRVIIARLEQLQSEGV